MENGKMLIRWNFSRYAELNKLGNGSVVCEPPAVRMDPVPALQG